MNIGKSLFAQAMEFLPWTSFARIVTLYSGKAGVRRMSCEEPFRVMAFAQLTWRESLRDIEVILEANARTSFTQWAFAIRCTGLRWPMPTNREIGEFELSLR